MNENRSELFYGPDHLHRCVTYGPSVCKILDCKMHYHDYTETKQSSKNAYVWQEKYIYKSEF